MLGERGAFERAWCSRTSEQFVRYVFVAVRKFVIVLAVTYGYYAPREDRLGIHNNRRKAACLIFLDTIFFKLENARVPDVHTGIESLSHLCVNPVCCSYWLTTQVHSGRTVAGGAL